MDERLRLLFQKFIDNTCSADELEEMFALIHQGGYENELRELVAAHYRSGAPGIPSAPIVDASGRLVYHQPAIRRRKKWKMLTIAACVLLLLGTAFSFWPDKPANKITNPVAAILEKRSTAVAENKYLLLPDSTEVWLNAGSSLEFPERFDSESRVVYLKGEAFFDVRHADKIPFIIHTGDVSTHVLGTAFNVKAYPGQKHITIAVSRGKVQVSRNNGVIATLVQGQQVKVGELEKQVVEQNVQPAGVGAWQKGQYTYQDETFADIIGDLERLYDVSIRLDERVDSEMRISTSFRKDIGVEQALLVLCKLTDKTVVKTDNAFYIE